MTVHAVGVVVQVAGDDLKAAAGLGGPERDVAAAAAYLQHARARRDAGEHLPPESFQRLSGSGVQRQGELRPPGEPAGPGRLRIIPAILGRHDALPWPLVGPFDVMMARARQPSMLLSKRGRALGSVTLYGIGQR